MKNILVGIDFHKETQVLISESAKLAKAFGAKVWLIHVAPPEPDFVGYDVGPQYIRDNLAEELREEHKKLQVYANQLESFDIEAEGLLIQGATVEMVLEESEKLNVDLIVVGHHEHSFFHSLLFESVSAKIVNKSKVPVLILPFGTEG